MPKPVDALIARTPLRHGEELRVALSAYRGRTYLDTRRHYQPSGDETWRPGKGLGVRVDLLPWLSVQLEAAEAAALDAGLLEAEDYAEHGLEVPAKLRGAV